MKKLTLLLLLTTLTLSATDKPKTKSVIHAVTVYLQGAQIQRSAMVTLKGGSNEIILNDLSPNISVNSIQISGLKSATVTAMNFNIDYLEIIKNSEEAAVLQKKLDQLALKHNQKNNAIIGLRQEEKVLEGNLKINSQQTDLNLEKVKQIGAYYRQRLTAIKNEQYSISKEVDSLKKELQKVRQELNKVKGNSKEQRGEIKLNLDSSSPTQLNLKITYNVSNAGWFPLYDIKAVSTSKPLEFVYKANVYQQTGSDWKNVKVKLSTGDPNTNNNKPNLDTKYLNFKRKHYGYRSKRLSATPPAPELMMMDDLEEEVVAVQEIQLSKAVQGRAAGSAIQEPVVYNQNVTAKEESITNTTFEITKQYSITSNGEVTIIEIDKFSTPATFEHYAAPEINENVFLTADIKNWEKYSLLAGEATLYFEGSYAGKTNLDPSATTDNLTVSLGVDPGVVIKRKQLDNFKSKSFIGATRIVDRAYEISIKNNKTSPINLTLEERIPITQNKEIKIETLEKDGAENTDKKGVLRWKLDINSQQTLKKKLSYQVKYPKGKKINL